MREVGTSMSNIRDTDRLNRKWEYCAYRLFVGVWLNVQLSHGHYIVAGRRYLRPLEEIGPTREKCRLVREGTINNDGAIACWSGNARRDFPCKGAIVNRTSDDIAGIDIDNGSGLRKRAITLLPKILRLNRPRILLRPRWLESGIIG